MSRQLMLRRAVLARHRTSSSTLVADWKADTLGLANNAAVTNWPDSAGVQSAITATGTALVYKTAQQNGLGAVAVAASNGAATTWAATTGQPLTVLLAMKLNSATATGTILDLGSGSTVQVFLTGTAWDMTNGTDLVRGTTDTVFHVLALHFEGASSYLRVDGVQQGAVGNAGAAGIGAGTSPAALAGQSAGYLLGELAVYTGIFPTAQEAALRTKWGTA